MAAAELEQAERGEAITIPVVEYEALLALQGEVDRLKAALAQARAAAVLGGPICVSPRAAFRGDSEVTTFVNEHATSRTIDWLTAEAERRFGADRAPSRSAIARYVQHVRRFLGVVPQPDRRCR